MNTDRFAATYKRPPDIPERERLLIVGALRCVKLAHLNDGPGRDLINYVKPNLVAVGSDWHENRYLDQIGVDREWLDRQGIAVVYLPRTPGVSTTDRRT